MKKRPFLKEFSYDLDEVQRAWLRKSVFILLTPFLLVMYVGFTIYDLFSLGFIESIKFNWEILSEISTECWRGK